MTDLISGPAPIAEHWDWQFSGLCRSMSPEIFFHPEGERGSARRMRDQNAKEICGACPVIAACRKHALAAREPFGVWGGMSEEERNSYYERHNMPVRRAS